MKKILIKNFPNLNNYGTAMMGIITIQSLIKNYGKDNVEIYCNFDKYAIIAEIKNEFNDEIEIKKYVNKKTEFLDKIKNPFLKRLYILYITFFPDEIQFFDKIIVLGGDDFSEYYSKYVVSIELFKLWRYSKHAEVILLGQTIGPFKNIINKLFIRYFLPKFKVYARDPWTVNYFKERFNITISQMGDLAFNALPLQSNTFIEDDILKTFSLKKENYITIVVSGLVKQGYYCQSEKLYLSRHREIISNALDLPEFINKKVVILAHTFFPYGDEPSLIQDLFNQFSENEKKRIVIITEKIYPTKARFILGNGLLTITGRMHPAVSTLQMGKPSIILSYSAKYKGVIGLSLNRSDLIIEANDNNLWENGEIVSLVDDKLKYVLSNYEKLLIEIANNVKIIADKNAVVLSDL